MPVRDSQVPSEQDPVVSDEELNKIRRGPLGKTVLRFVSQDPDRYPKRTAGVSFRGLCVSGYGSPLDYQKNVLNVVFQAMEVVAGLGRRNQQKIRILRNHDGLLLSGEMLLVLGRPGSGVSTLLKTIAGQTKGLRIEPEAIFSYKGKQTALGQTFFYAALAKTPQNRLPGVSRERYAAHMRDVIMAVFGLSHTINTKVGDDFVRGVSGGERKRVSIAEVALAQSPIQCWDNATRGLDSATALEFIRTVRLSVDLTGAAAVVALYQASQRAYEEFDKVTVLYEGRQIYFGPTDRAVEYFVDLGYHCPARQTAADFLTSLTNPSERVIRPGFEARVPRTPDEFAQTWRNSELRKQLIDDIVQYEIENQRCGKSVEEFTRSRQAQKSSWIRGVRRLLGDKSFFFITVFGNLFMSLILGSVFYDLPDTTAALNNRCILLFFAVLFNALNSSLEIFSLYAQRPVVEKHATYAFYHPLAEAIASAICDLPCKVLSTIAFNIPLYYMSNLRRESGHVAVYLLFAFTSTLTMSMIFRTIGQSSRTIAQALTPAALFVIGLVVYTGFVLPTRNMQVWLRWINYINPLAYSYEAIIANEFQGRTFACESFVPSGPNYSSIPGTARTCSVAGLPGAESVDGDMYMNATYRYYHSHVWRNFGILIGYIVFFGCVYVLLAEFVTAQASHGEVLLFQRKKVREVKRAQDEESRATMQDALDTAVAGDEKEKVVNLQRQTGVFHWRHVSYEVFIKGEKRRISDDIDGWVKPGTLTALMGASGAGKTTLLDVLASRVTTGIVTGDICVNGHPRDISFQRQVGYVQQQDIHLETTTIREALQFSALLRQPASIPKEDKLRYVEEVLSLLEMESYADAIVGVPGEGLNVEQRKRLTIGVELAAKPDLLQTAWSIASLLRKLSDHGQAILCTIHQPSAMLFQQFDRLLLLAKGGKTVYFGDIGENFKTLIDYFEKHGAEPCGPSDNPAEWMLRVIGAAPGSVSKRDWGKIWKSSPEYSDVQRMLDQINHEKPPQAQDASLSQQYAAPFRTQLWLCTKRVFEQYWRTPSYIYSKLTLCFGSALFIGLSFLNTKISILGLQHQMFAIFMLLVIFAFLTYQTMPNFIMQRTLYEARERPSKTYSWAVFMLANIVVELPWNTLAAVLIYLPFYYLVGMDKNAEATHTVTQRSGLMFLLFWSFMMHCATFTSMVVASVPTAEIGAILSLLMYAMCLIFCGVMAAPASLPGFWIFMYRASPLTYLVSAMLSTGLANTEVTCSDIEVTLVNPPAGQTCAEYLSAYMQTAGGKVYNPNATTSCRYCALTDSNMFLASVSSDYDERWRNFGLMWRRGGASIVQRLIKTGRVNVNAGDRWGRTPIFHAISYQNRQILEILLEDDSLDLSCQDDLGRTPLYSVSKGQTALTKMLLGHPRPYVNV
ncbi:uncharacterized protein CDV56_104774 [Aspergillus thermomutatus]|uniref:ABC transporter domain-containing protein n=1 Tax=Aspergillus thermomutatus TaxID=41047 RepID=A0A397H4G7_ASPTH|nr:uncharacterized protein CDV56_104774 [Aspergillus thermomutatus]RHZ57995.1 hypothetical protein CDV56_104774 [Aspergillus thermomutatus]